MTAEPLFLGIDGGGSKCRARLCDGTGRALGEGEASAASSAVSAAPKKCRMEAPLSGVEQTSDGARPTSGSSRGC